MGRIKETLFDFDFPPAPPVAGTNEFDGETYDKAIDYARLNSQLERVFTLMRDGEYRTLGEICVEVGGSDASVSARLRDLRKPKFGGHVVDRKRVRDGVFAYALKINPQSRGER